MTYIDIFIIGWNLNALMFVVNLLLAIKVIKTNDINVIQKQTKVLEELKNEFDEYYPNRKVETILTYVIPFTAFLRISFRLIEMVFFFSKNRGTTLYDFMVYKYSIEIQKAKYK